MTRGPLGKTTMGFIICMIFLCASIYLFARVSIARDNKQTEAMIGDVPAIVELYNSFINYPNFSSVEFTQDGDITLLNSTLEPIGTMKITNSAQIDVLQDVQRIYRDDYGVNFLYGSNYFSSISRIVFSSQALEDVKNKRSDNEIVTSLSKGVYMIVYSFDYDRFISPEEILTQLEEMKNVVLNGAEEFLDNV